MEQKPRIFGCLLFRISTPPKNQLVNLRNGTETRIFGCLLFRISTPPKNQLAGLRNGTETRIFECLLFRISTPPKNQLADLQNGTETYKSIGNLCSEFCINVFSSNLHSGLSDTYLAQHCVTRTAAR